MRIAVIGPVYNEAQFLPFSIMAVHPWVDEFVYAVSPKSDDGTLEILRYISKIYGKVKILIKPEYDFDPMDMAAYDKSFNDCIDVARAEAVWFLHPDMIVTNPSKIAELKEGPLAWVVNMTSFARDVNTVITKGRCTQWKNLHAKKFGLHYYGGYGSTNEDFYHSEITGKTYKHFGTEFQKYPFEVVESGINVNHYCELKPYKRRFEKMKYCLTTQIPNATVKAIEEMATHHPRVTLEASSERFGVFEFSENKEAVPEVFENYRGEFAHILKQKELIHG